MASGTCERRERQVGEKREDGRKEMEGRREKEESGEVRQRSCCCCCSLVAHRPSALGGARVRGGVGDRGSSPQSRLEALGVEQGSDVPSSPWSAFVRSPRVPYPLRSHFFSGGEILQLDEKEHSD
uniref:Uncharacterized protein n=1 Tax=Triticum urartu TaxID=4572 RepID=A0A8R7UYR9_TRIUA